MQEVLLATLSTVSSCNTLSAWISLAWVVWEAVGLDSALMESDRRLQWGDEDSDDENLRILRIFPIVVAVLIICIELVVACIYFGKVTSKRQAYTPAAPGSGEFLSQPWGCCDDCNYCMLGAFCIYQRAGDSAQAVGVGNFWMVVIVLMMVDFFINCMAIIPIPFAALFGVLIFGPIRGAFMSSIRSKERGVTGHDPRCNCCDFMMWWWCGCCASIQEAKEVDMATSTLVRTCCCGLEAGPGLPVAPAVVVGQPVQAVAVVAPVQAVAVEPAKGGDV
mmetsp:Transcript_45743/g.83784  ORF Transcript_45743/g.83784 Transcript_45743/m.83784 type:complete len:277 (-) Transcript_45743:96-926(-)